MTKAYKTILTVSFAFLGTGFLAVPVTFAQAPADNLIVQFENNPLFNEANFLPGEGVPRWIKVTNNSGSSQKVVIETINESDPDNFASQLNLVIKEGASELYNNTLHNFFDAGETYLSDLANGATAQYDLTVTFNSGSGNDYQEKSLGFDILVGFQGTEGGGGGGGVQGVIIGGGGGENGGEGGSNGGGGGGGGSSIPPGLSIFNEGEIKVSTTTATIEWETSYPATSWVIYAVEGETYQFNLLSANYGYPHSYPDPEDTLRVTHHSVSIPGLASGTTYHYRCVSHASLAVSVEHSFTTLGVKTNSGINTGTGEVEETTTVSQNGSSGSGDQQVSGGVTGTGGGEQLGGEEINEGNKGLVENSFGGEESPTINRDKEKSDSSLEMFLAAIGNNLGRKNLWLFLILIIIILSILLLFLRRRKKKKAVK